MKDGYINRETDSLIFTTWEHAINTNEIKGKIEKSKVSKCRMCGQADETVKQIFGKVGTNIR